LNRGRGPKSPDDFALYIRLKAENPITDAAETFIWVDFDGRRDRHVFSNLGEAIISNIPSKFKATDLKFQFESQQFRLARNDARYKIPDSGIIYLDVERNRATVENAIIFPRNIILGQNVGSSLVNIYFKFTNNIGRQFNISNLALNLTSSNGNRSILVPLYARVII
jgi:hypothetical protein